MSTSPFQFETFLSDVPLDINDGVRVDIGGTDADVELVEMGSDSVEGVDYRIRQLSYSSLLNLHECPRKFQLNRLRTTHRSAEDIKSTITFAFGHIVGEAIQSALSGIPEDQVIWKMFLGWHTDLFAADPKGNKSFWEAVIAIQRLYVAISGGFLNDYDVVIYNDKPACELSFAINFPDGFRLRGFVDAVLVHKSTGQVIVLECKTTGNKSLNPATYKNSSQAIGYSVVLDHIYPELSSYDVLYLVYQTHSRTYTPITFSKTYLQRALWIRELLLDIETIKLYADADIYPMRGESCFSFFRECEYFNTCTLSTEYLTKKMTSADLDTTDYQINISLADLLDTQLSKVGS